MPSDVPFGTQGGAPQGASRSASGPLAVLKRWLEPGDKGLKSAHFTNTRLAAALLAPQLLILLFFFFIPSWKALSLAFVQVDPFGGRELFVGWDNFTNLLGDRDYLRSAWMTFWFVMVQGVLTLVIAGALAFATDQVIRGRFAYKSMILLPYAIAPVVSGVLWAFLLNPSVGPLAQGIRSLGISWNPVMNPTDALISVTIATVWKHICYDYIFLVAAMLAVPQSLKEAAAIDGSGPWKRFTSISLPLIMPTVFFLFVMNFIYGMFDTFAIVDTMTRGGPAGSTATLVYKVYVDGFVMLNLGSSAAQSVILMIIAIVFTILQFRAVEKRVTYQV